ncbi:hypothetical protein LV89_03865 [Arcicella aurantiaca]|uniref:SpoIIAA-like protein n=1 Tax=Arcicella aurantiaca TaxID=591202 RepID=A0A316DQ11_9BACT|nr:hypothetical protein [Arcicella aurantiaca]PWK20055.1 hypothetical protein LV89_03865 [Arcicella aurantiaca]
MIELQKASHCPIFKLILGKYTTVQDTQKYLTELSLRVDKQDLFGIVMVFTDGQPTLQRGCQKLEKNWLTHHKDSFHKYCFGIAMVTNSWTILNVWSPIIKQLLKRFLKVEYHVFDCNSDAQIWLMDKYLAIKRF